MIKMICQIIFIEKKKRSNLVSDILESFFNSIKDREKNKP
jgi:hypothetical protein